MQVQSGARVLAVCERRVATHQPLCCSYPCHRQIGFASTHSAHVLLLVLDAVNNCGSCVYAGFSVCVRACVCVCVRACARETKRHQMSFAISLHVATDIMNNMEQHLFDYCTAKFSDNTQCCVPVFDIRHELPLCPEHAAKAVSEVRIYLAVRYV